MPLSHIRCASARLERNGTTWTPTPAECVEHGMSRENDCGMSGELLESMYDKQQNRSENISTSALLSECPRQLVIERKDGYIVDPRRLYAAWRGEMAHRVQEGHMRPVSWGEQRVWMRHPMEPDQFVSCKPDRVDPDLGKLWDIKSAEELPKGNWKTPYPKHVKQLQMNRFIIDHAEWLGEDDPAPLKTTMVDGQKWKTYQPHPNWQSVPDWMKPAEWTGLYIEYIAFEGSTILACDKSNRVQADTPSGWKWGPRLPDIWEDDLVLALIEEHYYQVKKGLDELADPDGFVPPIPEHLAGWPVDKRSPCNWCDVRPNCMKREFDAGLPSLAGDPVRLLAPELLRAR